MPGQSERLAGWLAAADVSAPGSIGRPSVSVSGARALGAQQLPRQCRNVWFVDPEGVQAGLPISVASRGVACHGYLPRPEPRKASAEVSQSPSEPSWLGWLSLAGDPRLDGSVYTLLGCKKRQRTGVWGVERAFRVLLASLASQP